MILELFHHDIARGNGRTAASLSVGAGQGLNDNRMATAVTVLCDKVKARHLVFLGIWGVLSIYGVAAGWGARGQVVPAVIVQAGDFADASYDPGQRLEAAVGGRLVLKVLVRPQDMDNVAVGQTAVIRMRSSRRYPIRIMSGQVVELSALGPASETMPQAFLAAHILISDDTAAGFDAAKFKSGMQAELLVRSSGYAGFHRMFQSLAGDTRIAGWDG